MVHILFSSKYKHTNLRSIDRYKLSSESLLSNQKAALSLFSSHRKNWFAARCEDLHLIKLKELTAVSKQVRRVLFNKMPASTRSEPVFAMDDWKRGFLVSIARCDLHEWSCY